MYNPISTYRIQFHKEFTIDDLQTILPYLQELGIGTLYASPVFEATPGSTHGYDALDSNRINPEVGTEDLLRKVAGDLKGKGIGWLQDIVPNHMAFDPRNPWLLDVLEKGPQSVYAKFFDVAWAGNLHHGRLMVPFLGSPLHEVIQKDELQLAYENGRLVLKYYEAAYPLSRRSYALVLGGDQPQAIRQLVEQSESISAEEDAAIFSERWSEWLLQLKGLMKNEVVNRKIMAVIHDVNSDKSRLEAIAGEQHYHLCHWQETDSRINYRRFFTVNGLICLNIQDPQVLEAHHSLVRQLVKEGVFTGLRIDHIDGLYDPTRYLEDLRKMVGEQTYVVVEKILEPGERQPLYWPVQGNSGYDFLSLVNNLLTYPKSEEPFTEFYYTLVSDHRFVPQQVRDKKAQILYHHMGGELDNLYHLLMESGLVSEEDYAQMRTEDIRTAIAEVLIHCPVYRFYGNTMPLAEEEAASLQLLFEQVRTSRPDLSPAIALLEGALIHRPQGEEEGYRTQALHFYRRCMQFTGPLMAKGVEDTLMYTFNRFIGHNEVGDSPEAFGMSASRFHGAMQDRQRHWPLSINGTSTHDTKRGEDVRARLNVLSELPEEWLDAVRSWQKINEPLKKEAAPDCNDEYFIYQSLIGTWPMPGQPQEAYGDRLKEYLQKALREAKRHSNWTAPDTAYEEAAQQFALSLLDQQKPFWKSFRVLQEKVAGFGVINSLVQTVLKFTCPGVPDVYQGCEGWDLSFVDPDNRRPVDFEWRAKRLKEIKESEGEEGFLEKLWEDRFDAGIKIWLTQKLMHLRRQKPQLLTYGDYQPLEVEGKYREHVLAFARSGQGSVVIVAVPLFAARLCTRQGKDWEDLNWEDTIVKFPGNVVDEWESVEGEKLTVRGNLSVNTLFKQLPFAVLKGRTAAKPRGAGVLLHLSSLPSPFGIGDMGPEAYAFADFLGRSRQKYWQLLPLNPTEEGQGHSPYSSISSMAGNPLFISPQLLIEDGLLEHADLEDTILPPESRTLYAEAGWIKGALLDTAFERFSGGSFPELSSAFEAFRKAEAGWLEDFALYSVLKDFNEGRPWYQWEEAYKLREKTSLLALKEEEKESVTRVAFIQFLFSRQWQQLKGYCNGQGIQMLGDLPIYVSYDSADVWANRELFKLNENGERLGLAGVPPDAFSADGQLWGMPVYDWDALKETGYQWWITRLKKNCELFDLVRLDHFRAFADYWEVPAGEKTAKNGSWKPGPGAPFFEAIEKALGELPFVAEDLGEINDAVIRLRDQFHLPGMKILQFAFDDNMPGSDYIPHNYTKNFLVYTGTHDNNTVRGWYRDEANEETRTRVQQYIGRSLAEEEVHSELCRLAFASVANLVILPVQDLLGLGTEARMNIPASGENNWAWRLLPGQINEEAERQLQQWTKLYGRA